MGLDSALLITVRPQILPEWPSEGEASHRLESGALRVVTKTRSPFGFTYRFGEKVIAGESCSPLHEWDKRIIDKAVSGADRLDAFLGDRFLLLTLIDLHEHTVRIAHSIAGWRPYYLWVEAGTLTLSSSLRGLQTAGHRIAWNAECMPEFLMYRFIVPPRSIAHGVRKVIGGQLVSVNLKDGSVREEGRWPRLADDSADVTSVEGFSRALRSRLDEWLVSFPNAGILLSGGLDSSLLAALAQQIRPGVQTFSTNFSFTNDDDGEERYAVSMAEALATPHEVHRFTSERYLAGWVESIAAAEEPIHHLQSVLLYLLFRDRASANHGAILSGEGADGVFGNAAHGFLFRHRRAIGLLRASGSVLAPFGNVLSLFGRVGILASRRYDAHVDSARHFIWLLGRHGDSVTIRRLLSCDEAAVLGARRALLEPYRDLSLLDQVTRLSLLSEAHATIAIWGKLAEACGARLVCPFTIPSVFRAADHVPWDIKLRETKHLVRAALRELAVPEALVMRPKLSFGLPARFWAPPGALFQPAVEMARVMYDPAVLVSLQTAENGRAMVLWGLLNRFFWGQLFEQGRAVDDLNAELLDRHRARMRRPGWREGHP